MSGGGLPADVNRYRVLASPRADDEWLLLEPGSADPAYVAGEGYEGSLAERVAALEPGNLVAADVGFAGERPLFLDLDVLERTRFAFAREADPLFQAARECWEATRSAGEAMGSRLTRDTDGAVNGVVYTFAEQRGERDLFAEFQDGIRPLEPLLARIEGADPPYELFVLDPSEPCVVVCIALERDGLLASTLRDTYLGGGDGGGNGDGGGEGDSEFGGLGDLAGPGPE
jgi:hypothetical protein